MRYNVLILTLLIVSVMVSCRSAKRGQEMVATMELNEEIEGLCDPEFVVAVLPFPGSTQKGPVPPKSEEALAHELSEKVKLSKSQQEKNLEGMLQFIVNCEGSMRRCQMSNSTGDETLDKAIVKIASKLEIWEPGKVGGKAVDTVDLMSFTIEKGVFKIN